MFGKEGEMWNWADAEHSMVRYTEKYLDMKKKGTLSGYGVNCLTVLMNLAYLDPITSHEGDKAEEIYFDNLKRPIRSYCYSYKISWPKLDSGKADYMDIIRAKTKMDARWGEYLPDIIKASSADKATNCFRTRSGRWTGAVGINISRFIRTRTPRINKKWALLGVGRKTNRIIKRPR